MYDRLTKQEYDDYCENAGLSEQEKQVLKLRYFLGKSVIEICDEMNISDSTYRRRKNKLLMQIMRYENKRNR